MASPTTATTVFVLTGGALLAIGAYTLSRKWEAQKQASMTEVAIALSPGVVTLAYAWWVAGEHRPSPIQAIASGIRGASRGGI